MNTSLFFHYYSIVYSIIIRFAIEIYFVKEFFYQSFTSLLIIKYQRFFSYRMTFLCKTFFTHSCIAILILGIILNLNVEFTNFFLSFLILCIPPQRSHYGSGVFFVRAPSQKRLPLQNASSVCIRD